MTSSVTGASALVCINSVEIHPVVVRGQRVLTFTQIDKVHGRPEGTARRNFTENKSRLIEGQDFFVITRKSSMDEIRALGNIPPKGITVVTESGYLLLVKSFTDDLAWQIQRELVNAYFRVNPERVVGESYDTLIPSEQQTLSEIVHAKVSHLAPDLQGKGLAEVWSRLHHKFRIAKYSQLPRTRLAEAILYVTQMTLRGVPSTPVTPEPMPETLSAQQYDELTRALRPLYGLLNNESVQTAIHDHVRVTMGVRHLKDIPAAKFAQAMLLAKDIRARCEIIGRVGSEFLDEMVRAFIAANAPCTLVLARQYKQKFKAEVPKYPNWLEIQQQLQSAKLADPEKSHAE